MLDGPPLSSVIKKINYIEHCTSHYKLKSELLIILHSLKIQDSITGIYYNDFTSLGKLSEWFSKDKAELACYLVATIHI